MKSRSLFLAAAAVVTATSCADCGPVVEGLPPGNLCGVGQVDGVDYALAADGNEVVITVAKEDAFGCGALHSHVVLATVVAFEYDLKGDATGEVKITVPAAGLDPDDKDLRLKYLPDGENQELSDGDRQSIRGSVSEEVKASEFKDLIFTLKDLSTLDGDGTATLVSDIAGATSEVAVAYNAKKDGDDVTVSGTATIAGGPHGIPRNALGFCVSPDMDLSFTLTLTPGTQECKVGGDVVPPFEETFFDDTECGDVGYNVVYNNVVGPRCMGCHGGILADGSGNFRGGATVAFGDWRSFRVDSLRNPGAPLFQKAHEYVNLPSDDPEVLAMPPSASGESTALQDALLDATGAGAFTTERELFNAWVAAGGRDAQCADDVEQTVFTRTEPGDCLAATAITYEAAQADHADASAKDFFEGNCMYCHATGHPDAAPSAPPVGTYDAVTDTFTTNFVAGAAVATHPFYVTAAAAPLSFWEASVHRTNDGSMPTGSAIGGYEGDDGFEAFKAWVAAGYCP